MKLIHVAIGAIVLTCSFVTHAALEESLKPEPLRDRLINVERTFVEHKRRMDAQDNEMASILLRLKHLEQMLFERGPIVLDKGVEKKAKESKPPRKVKPYRYN